MEKHRETDLIGGVDEICTKGGYWDVETVGQRGVPQAALLDVGVECVLGVEFGGLAEDLVDFVSSQALARHAAGDSAQGGRHSAVGQACQAAFVVGVAAFGPALPDFGEIDGGVGMVEVEAVDRCDLPLQVRGEAVSVCGEPGDWLLVGGGVEPELVKCSLDRLLTVAYVDEVRGHVARESADSAASQCCPRMLQAVAYDHGRRIVSSAMQGKQALPGFPGDRLYLVDRDDDRQWQIVAPVEGRKVFEEVFLLRSKAPFGTAQPELVGTHFPDDRQRPGFGFLLEHLDQPDIGQPVRANIQMNRFAALLGGSREMPHQLGLAEALRGGDEMDAVLAVALTDDRIKSVLQGTQLVFATNEMVGGRAFGADFGLHGKM